MRSFNHFLPMMQGRHLSIVLLLGFHTVLSEIFHVFVPDYPITVSVGEDVVLDCQVVPDISLDTLEVRWFISNSASQVHLYTGGQDRPDVQDKGYQGRTELFKDELPRGNASLKLKKIEVSDEGIYTCFIKSKTHHDQAVIALKVAEFGQRPWVDVEENNKGLCVVCRSDGWYPEPLIQWVDGKGDATVQSETEFIQDPTGLITVQSRINVQSDSVNKFSCFIENQLLSKRREAHLQISDEFFPRVNAWLVCFLVFLGLVIAAITIDVIVHRKEDEKIKELQEFLTLEGFNKLEINRVSVTLDVETAYPELEVSEDLKSLRWTGTRRDLPDTGKRFTHWECALGSEGFTSGRHYWEVEVVGNRVWRLGVASESVERKDWVRLIPENGFWTIGRKWDQFYINNTQSPLPVGQVPGKVGVYLSYESGTVSFYNVDTKSHLHTFTGNKFTGKLYPFFGSWHLNQFLRICSKGRGLPDVTVT
ncbi:butyrophilin subfamily 1 member A1-like [Stegostoma tigrinum]|uniref:butyrophilin subfamily 1 member A1-like n=1 Tax=Stegostoma tigrinum TaxID=3053191 RepID=UPI00286FC730|nr:butyrophilin subfamily 1 member A1-like [Stegostoma tigrinum]XP_059495462.1 butyrophilin subfamily 1 member A1-like [Stegostoma tigrinum]XP_059495463.1 butyrophilin subfamily 1 member A1-like [Stegostoma tigrinum]XP_059495464.1 butyrophilin subfamily 1 member A1-like [Stegostoma tigrinum]